MQLFQTHIIDQESVRGRIASLLLAWHIAALPQVVFLTWPLSQLVLVRQSDRDLLRRVALNPTLLKGSAALVVICGRLGYDGKAAGERYYRNLLLSAGSLSKDIINNATGLGLRPGTIASFLDDPLASELGIDVAYEQPLVAIVLS